MEDRIPSNGPFGTMLCVSISIQIGYCAAKCNMTPWTIMFSCLVVVVAVYVFYPQPKGK